MLHAGALVAVRVFELHVLPDANRCRQGSRSCSLERDGGLGPPPARFASDSLKGAKTRTFRPRARSTATATAKISCRVAASMVIVMGMAGAFRNLGNPMRRAQEGGRTARERRCAIHSVASRARVQ
jgi:hypothetical protein